MSKDTTVKLIAEDASCIQPIIDCLNREFSVQSTSPVIYDQNTRLYHKFVLVKGQPQ